MRAGALRHPIEIQRQSGATQDAYGSYEETWEPVLRTRAAINPGRGREFETAHQIHSEITHLVTIRFDARLNIARASEYRILHERRVLNIIAAVIKDERDREILISATEITNT